MAVSFVASTELRTGGTSAAGAVSATAGNQLVACVAEFGTPNTGTVSVSGGGTWTSDVTAAVVLSMKISFGSCTSAAGGSNTITVTFSNTANIAGITAFIHEYSGLATASMFGSAGTQASGTSATPATGTLAPATSGDLLIAATAYNAANNTPYTSTGTGWTQPTGGTEPDGVNWLIASSGYKVSASTASDSEAWSRSGSSDWVALIATYKQAGAAAQDTPELRGRPFGLSGQNQMQQLLAQ